MKALLIDDEPDCLAVLSHQLKAHCPAVEIVSAISKSTQALRDISRLQPDIVFMDIEMPQLNGFQLLDEIGDLSFALIFTTAYDRFAVRAFKYAALDYLLKPIDPAELIAAVAKAKLRQQTDLRQLELLERQLKQGVQPLPQRIAMPVQKGYSIMEPDQILYCESEGSYTRFFLQMGENQLITRILGDVEDTLEGGPFFRAHKSWLVNINHVRQFFKSDGAHLVMSDGKHIPVARNRKEDFQRLLRWL